MSFVDEVGDLRLPEALPAPGKGVGTTLIRVTLLSMFQAIDSRRWDKLVEFFNDDVEYIRPGYPTIYGLESLRTFYAETRVIASGCHKIEGVYFREEDLREANVIGSFRGLDRQGRQLAVRFCDAYRFVGEKITRRESYFNSPAV